MGILPNRAAMVVNLALASSIGRVGRTGHVIVSHLKSLRQMQNDVHARGHESN